MGRFPGEASCLTLVWAVLDLLITHADQRHPRSPRSTANTSTESNTNEADHDTLDEEVTAA